MRSPTTPHRSMSPAIRSRSFGSRSSSRAARCSSAVSSRRVAVSFGARTFASCSSSSFKSSSPRSRLTTCSSTPSSTAASVTYAARWRAAYSSRVSTWKAPPSRRTRTFTFNASRRVFFDRPRTRHCRSPIRTVTSSSYTFGDDTRTGGTSRGAAPERSAANSPLKNPCRWGIDAAGVDG